MDTNIQTEVEKTSPKVFIDQSILDSLPSIVKGNLSSLNEMEQSMFVEEYNRKKKSVGLAYLCHIFFFSCSYGYLHKWGLQILYWLTGAGFLIWFLIRLFTIPGSVRAYNQDVAIEAMRNVKLLAK